MALSSVFSGHESASAQRVSQGFLPDCPEAPYYGTVSLPLACPPSRSRGGTRKEGTVNIAALEPYREHGGQGARPLWRIDDLAEEPVSSRAWCMQELLMSPRSLVFGLHTLQFHCRTSTTNIAGPFRNSSTSIAGAKLPTECLLDDPPLVVRGSAQWTWYDWTGRPLNSTTKKFTVPALNNSIVFEGQGLSNILPKVYVCIATCASISTIYESQNRHTLA